MFLKILYALTLVTSLSNNTLFANDGCCNPNNVQNVTCGWIDQNHYCAFINKQYYVYNTQNKCNMAGTTAVPDLNHLCRTMKPNQSVCKPPCEGGKKGFAFPTPQKMLPSKKK